MISPMGGFAEILGTILTGARNEDCLGFVVNIELAAASRFQDTELGAPLVTLSPGGTMPASARLCRLLGQNDHRHCSDGRLVKSLYAIML